MHNSRQLIFVTAAALFVSAWMHATAFAGAFEDGQAAYAKEDYQTAMKLWQPLADQGNPEAQYEIGSLYRWGLAVKQDYTEAMKWFRKAADQGNPKSAVSIGEMYNQGEGVVKDYIEAMNWYRKGADMKYSGAFVRIAELYNEGHGVNKDYAEGVKWYRQAAAQGNTVAMRMLYHRYKDGEGVDKNEAEAIKWLREAAELGHYHSQVDLADYYKESSHSKKSASASWIGTKTKEEMEQSKIQAYMWFSIAIANPKGTVAALKEQIILVLSDLQASMTPEQLEEARRLAAEWKPSKK